MLKIYLGEMEDAIYYPPVYFDNQYADEWITDEFAKRMILDVDKSEVISANLIQSPVMGAMFPKSLSGGVKTLLLMKYDRDGNVFNASACGDNCAKWILEMSRCEDLTINLRHTMDFGEEFEAYILNTGEMVHNMKEFICVAAEYV